jgi:hypothetical protein
MIRPERACRAAETASTNAATGRFLRLLGRARFVVALLGRGPATAARARLAFEGFADRLTVLVKAMVFVVVFQWLDPFSIGEAVNRASADIVSRIIGACYPTRYCLPGLAAEGAGVATGQQRVAVVLYDDAFLADTAHGHAWPPPLSYHARLLNALSAGGARAVFFDVLFGHDRGNTANAFAEEIRAAQEDGTDVVLAQLPAPKSEPGSAVRASGGGTSDTWLLPVLADAAKSGAPVAWQNDHPWQAGLRYPCAAERREGEFVPTPAVALYRIMQGEEAVERTARCVGDDPARAEERQRQGIALAWGLPISETMHQFRSRTGCLRSSDGAWPWAKAYLRAVLVGLDRQNFFGQQPCPYIDTYSAIDVLTNEDVRDALKGRAVLVGVGYRASNDVIETPFGSMVSGVYLHATALDNLLTFGPEDHYRADDEVRLSLPLRLRDKPLPLKDEHLVEAMAVLLPAAALLAMPAWTWGRARAGAIGSFGAFRRVRFRMDAPARLRRARDLASARAWSLLARLGVGARGASALRAALGGVLAFLALAALLSVVTEARYAALAAAVLAAFRPVRAFVLRELRKAVGAVPSTLRKLFRLVAIFAAAAVTLAVLFDSSAAAAAGVSLMIFIVQWVLEQARGGQDET